MNRFHFWLTLGLSHQRRMTKAAGVSRAKLVCHPDTWDEITGMSSKVGIPLNGDGDIITREDGLAVIPLSGVSLSRVLQITRKICQEEAENAPLLPAAKHSATDRAVAARVYLAVAHSLGKVERYQTHGEPMPDIVIDDRPGATTSGTASTG